VKKKLQETNIDFSDDAVGTVEEVINEDEAVVAEPQLDDDIIDEDLDPLDRLPKEAVRNLDGSVTLPLSFPVTLKTRKNGNIKERTFKELKFNRMNGAALRAVGAAPDQHQTTVALAQSTGINQAVMNALYDKMMDYDIGNSGRVINHFLASGPKGGKQN